MEALISGTLGTATLFDGDVAEVIWIDGRRTKMRPAIARSFHRNVDDTVCYESCTEEQALGSLRLHWMKDRSLALTLLLLDASTPSDERSDIQEYLNDWAANDDVAKYLKCVMYARPLPNSGIVDQSEIDCESIIGKLLKTLFENQNEIRRVRNSWERAASNLSNDHQRLYEQRLVAIGAFYRLMSPSKREADELKFECLEKLSDLPNFRDVISNFVDPFVDLSISVVENTHRQAVIEFSENNEDYEETAQAIGSLQGSSREQFLHVRDRMEVAASHFSSREIDKAVKVVNWLVDEQRDRGDNEHAAKTLCSASEMAKRADRYDLQLEFAVTANELAPEDDRVCGHIGDAYLNLGRLDEARTWFTRAAEGEDREFGLGGLVRVLQKENRLEEAYDLVLEVLQSPFAGIEPWLQKSEILRGLARYEDAIEAYAETVKRYPDNHVPLCGMAATFANAGLYEQAMSTYDSAISRFENISVAYTAKGHLLARLGLLGQALPYLQRGIDTAENKTVAVNALASALRISGKNGRAINLLEKEVRKNPNSEEIWSGLVQSATECGRYTEAAAWMLQARNNLGRTPAIIFQEVKILAARGNYADALELASSILEDSPHHLEAALEKSRLLRRLNRYSEAQEEVRPFLDIHRQNHWLKEEATLLGLIEVSEDVVTKRAGAQAYATLEDWEYDHACSSILLGSNKAKDAWRISLDGKKRSPFRSLRKRFGLLVAIARDMLGRTGSVVNALKGYIGYEAPIMRAVAYWKLGLTKRLAHELATVQNSANFGSRSNSIVSDLVGLVSDTYRGERDDQRVFAFERRILHQAV